ncbi:MAG: hypothetical protein AAGA54_19670 [Myxococcota bacterium]
MRRTLVSSSIVLGLTLLGGSSCRVTVGKPTDPATGSDPKPPVTAADGNTDAAPGGKRTNPGGKKPAAASVWGHMMMPNPQKTIEKIAKKVAPPMMAPMVSTAQLKSALSMQFEGRSGVVQHIDLAKPAGCLVANPKQYDEPLVCAVAYDGGLTQLIEDLGTEGYVSGGDGYAAYELGGSTMYFRAFGSHIGIAAEPTLLAASEDYINAELVVAGKVDREVYGKAMPAVVFRDARPEIEEFFAEMESTMEQNPSGASGDYMAASGKATRAMYESFADLSAMEGVFRIGKQRSKMIYRATASEGSPTAEQYAREAKMPKVDLGILEGMPDEAFFVGGMSFDFENLDKDPMMAAYMTAFRGLKTAEGKDMGELMTRMMTAFSDVSAGPVGFAAFPQKGSMGVLAASYKLKPGANAMAIIRDFRKEYRPEAFMPSFAEYVDTTYKKNAFTVNGVKADTYTFSPTAKAVKDMKSSGEYADLVKVMGKVQFVMAFAQKDDQYYMVFTTTGGRKALGRMMNAAAGKGSLGKFDQAKKRIRKQGDSNALMMLDVKGMLDWVRTLDADQIHDIPDVGGALDDVIFTGGINKRGKKEYSMSMSQGLMDQLRNL